MKLEFRIISSEYHPRIMRLYRKCICYFHLFWVFSRATDICLRLFCVGCAIFLSWCPDVIAPRLFHRLLLFGFSPQIKKKICIHSTWVDTNPDQKRVECECETAFLLQFLVELIVETSKCGYFETWQFRIFKVKKSWKRIVHVLPSHFIDIMFL